MMEEQETPVREKQSEMSVSILFFSVLRDRIGSRSVTLRIAEPASIDDVVAQLAERFQPVKEMKNVVRVALNAEYARGTDLVQDGDEIAIITPVSGG